MGWSKKNKIFIFEILLVALFIASALLYANNKPLIRDFVIANVAHIRAGEPIPFEEDEPGYTRERAIDPPNYLLTYQIQSNSFWMAEYARLIVPYFGYEFVTPNPRYPKIMGAIPFQASESFHIGGRMIPVQGGIVLLNERYFLDERWNDKRRALGVLVHELVHVQGGAYLQGESWELESATSIATLEVLAAMCNYGDTLACPAFWRNVEHFARTSLKLKLQASGLGGLYTFWANTFWRDDYEQDAFEKSMRFWENDPETLKAIYFKYNLVPWNVVVNGVATGDKLNTKHANCDSYGCYVIGMPFDDITALLGNWLWLVR
jgi:hypothetical protein